MGGLKWWAVAVAAAVVPAARAAEAELRLDAVLTTSNGEKAHLSARRGRPVVLFYEDKDSVALNQETKDALYKLGKDRGLLEAVAVLGVANLEGFNWQPALFFALEAVKAAERSAGVPVYVDLNGTLTRAPWNLSKTTSTVVLLDSSGKLAFQAKGRLTSEQRQTLFARLEDALARPVAP